MAEFRAGDWHCPGCRNHNFARNAACRQCGVPRPLDGGGMGGYGRPPMDAGAGMPANFRPGDWLCACGNHNFARNQYCRDCQQPKPMDGGYGAPMPPMMAPPMMGGGGGSGWREGDWQCMACRAHNFASRQACRDCSAPRPAAGAGMGGMGGGYGSGWKPGDWSCPGCNYHNFARYDTCRQCSSARPQGGAAPGYGQPQGGAPGGFLPGDWNCSCGEHNFAKRMTCRACSKPQPQPTA